MNDNRDQLIALLLSGELTVEQQTELCRLAVADKSVAGDVLDQMWLEPLLRDSLREDADSFVDRIETAINCESADSEQFTEQVLDAWSNRIEQSPRGKRSPGRWTQFGGGVAVALLLMVGFFLVIQNDSGQRAHAASIQLLHATGHVQVIGPGGESRNALPGTKLEPGDTIMTSGESSATLLCRDGSRLTVTRDASVSLPADGPHSVFLNSGVAVVTKTTNRESTASGEESVLIKTQHAILETTDAKLLLATSDRQTDVSVERGNARFQISGGESLTVIAGSCAVATDQSVELRRGLATPDEWSEEFESGVPAGWVGHPIDKDLPAGSRGAIGTAALKNDRNEDCHQIWSGSEWTHGLGVVHPNSSLNFVYRFKQADSVQVMTLLRSPLPDSPDVDIHILPPSDVPSNERWWDIPSNQWYVASIPLSQLSNPVTLDHPEVRQVITAFNFRPQDHACGLVIDRMWLARGESKRIEFRPLD